MQGKGLIRFFLILLVVVSLVQYLFVIPTNRIEKKATQYAESVSSGLQTLEKDAAFKEAYAAYLDSLSGETVFSIPLVKKYTYEDLKKQQLALGLDLKGGMSVVLQVDLKEFLTTMANKSTDETFTTAIKNAEARLKTDQSDIITLFGQEFAKIANGKKLSSIFRNNPSLRDQINIETSDADVISLLRTAADETVDRTYKLLKDRIDKLNVTQPNISLDSDRDLIFVELPGISNAKRAETYLQSTAKLEFWNVYRVTDAGILESFATADERLKLIMGDSSAATTVVLDSVPALDSLNQPIKDSFIVTPRTVGNAQAGPLLNAITLNIPTAEGAAMTLCVMGLVQENQKSRVMDMLNHPDVKGIFPRDVMFRWSQEPFTNFTTGEVTNQYELYALKQERTGEAAPLEGDQVVDARESQSGPAGELGVTLRMNSKGAKKWGEMTTLAAQDNNREIAIVLDDEVVSSPRVINPILDGNSSITGNFTVQEAKDLANILQVGKLPAKTQIIQQNVVGATLGNDNIQKSMTAMIVAFLAVVAFMVFYYGGGGLVAILALFLNILFIFGALGSMGTVLTLPGIAGIVLTMGMAVDANVIIYERIREELALGKSLLSAIRDGYKHSASAIIDANVTTLLAAAAMLYAGLGPIKGFAVVLSVGVLSSLFTAVLVSRMVIEWWISKGREITFWIPPTKNLFKNVTIDWLRLRKFTYAFSIILTLAGLISIFTRGFDLGVDFRGGYSYNVQFDANAPVTAQQIRDALTPVFEKSPIVKEVSTYNTYNITTDYLINESSLEAQEQVSTKLFEGINTLMGGNLDKNSFLANDFVGTHVTSSSKVGPTIADDIQNSAFTTSVLALVLIFIYLLIRFNKWQFSFGAVVATAHDAFITISIFSLLKGLVPFSLEVDQAFVAAILTIIGYSINDTVVVYDRIREYINTYTHKSPYDTINGAINSTLSRTLITSGTTLLVVLFLFVLGGPSIKGFAFALLTGILAGTYSSVFVASPLMYDLTKDFTAKRMAKEAHFSKAAKIK